jgi:hypothetical protein
MLSQFGSTTTFKPAAWTIWPIWPHEADKWVNEHGRMMIRHVLDLRGDS